MAIYCPQCGKESQTDARFCSTCGRPFAPEAVPYAQGAYIPPSGRRLGTLRRARAGRKIAGVCQGIANHWGWDVSVVRIVMLLFAIAGFPIGFIVYALVWLIAPEEALTLPASTYVSQGQASS